MFSPRVHKVLRRSATVLAFLGLLPWALLLLVVLPLLKEPLSEVLPLVWMNVGLFMIYPLIVILSLFWVRALLRKPNHGQATAGSFLPFIVAVAHYRSCCGS
jgi:hypothetical protein